MRILSLPPRSSRNASKSEIRISRFTLDANPLASAKLEKVRLDYFLNEFFDFSGKIEGAENDKWSVGLTGRRESFFDYIFAVGTN